MSFPSKIISFYVIFITVAATPILRKEDFPFYDYIHSCIPIYLREKLNGNASVQYWTKIAWWASFVAGDGGLIDNIIVATDASKSCKAYYWVPGTSCRDDIFALVKMSITNGVKGIVGVCVYCASDVDEARSPFKRRVLTGGLMIILILFIQVLKAAL